MKVVFALFFALLAVSGCTGEEADLTNSAPAVMLVPVDSVGIEIGDEDYVFGVISAVDFLQDGRLLILDSSRQTLRLFSLEGEYITEYGGTGEAPGEFLSPRDIAVLRGGVVVVTDPRAAKFEFFHADSGHIGALQGFSPRAPFSIAAAGDIIVGHQALFDRDQGRTGEALSGWGMDSPVPRVVFTEEWSRFDPSEMAARFMDPDPPLQVTDDRVFYAPLDWERHRIIVFNPDGSQAGVWSRPGFVPVRKTPDQIAEEIAFYEQRRQQMLGMGMGGRGMAAAEYAPSEYYFAVASLGLDETGRLWARRGSGEEPVFDLFDTSTGDYLGLAMGPGSMGSWTFVITPFGIAAYEEDPVDYPRVVLLDYADPEREESQ